MDDIQHNIDKFIALVDEHWYHQYDDDNAELRTLYVTMLNDAETAMTFDDQILYDVIISAKGVMRALAEFNAVREIMLND